MEFIRRGRPLLNGSIERFNRTYREAVLNMYIFETLDEVRQKTDEWIEIYDHHRRNASLGDSPPSEFLARHLNPTTLR
ncbi:MAG: transposase [Pyrinomonadaceae bacterium]